MANNSERSVTVVPQYRDSRSLLEESSPEDVHNLARLWQILNFAEGALFYNQDGEEISVGQAEAILSGSNRFKEQEESRRGTISEIKEVPSSHEYGSPTLAAVVLGEGAQVIEEYPLTDSHQLAVGMEVIITPHTTYHQSGGSLTLYSLRPLHLLDDAV